MSEEPVQSTNTEFSSDRVAKVSKYASSAALSPVSRRPVIPSRLISALSTMNFLLLESPQT